MGVGVLQPWHLIIIVVIVLVIFGPGKLPMLGKAVGDSVRDFKKAIGSDDTAKSTTAEAEPATRICSNCRRTLKVSDSFCGECGARTDLPAA